MTYCTGIGNPFKKNPPPKNRNTPPIIIIEPHTKGTVAQQFFQAYRLLLPEQSLQPRGRLRPMPWAHTEPRLHSPMTLMIYISFCWWISITSLPFYSIKKLKWWPQGFSYYSHMYSVAWFIASRLISHLSILHCMFSCNFPDNHEA